MQEISSTFNFVKSANWPENVISDVTQAGSAQTSDFSLFIIVFLAALFALTTAIFICVRKYKCFSVAELTDNVSQLTIMQFIKNNKFSVSVIFAIVLCLITVCLFSVTKIVANAEEETPLCSLTDINVSVLDTGIESVEPAYLINETTDSKVIVDSLRLGALDKSIENSNWIIKYDENVLFNGSPGESVVPLANPIILDEGSQIKLNIEITMDAQTAIALINKSPVNLSLFVSPKMKKGNLRVTNKIPVGGTTAIDYTYAPVLKEDQKFEDIGVVLFSDSNCTQPILNSEGNPVQTMSELYQAIPAGGTEEDHYVGASQKDIFFQIDADGGQLGDGILYAIRAVGKHSFNDISNDSTESSINSYCDSRCKDRLDDEKWAGLDWTKNTSTNRPKFIVNGDIIADLGDSREAENVYMSYGATDGKVFSNMYDFWASYGYTNTVAYYWQPYYYDWRDKARNEDSNVIFLRGFALE